MDEAPISASVKRWALQSVAGEHMAAQLYVCKRELTLSAE
jgi:hypothetical protein